MPSRWFRSVALACLLLTVAFAVLVHTHVLGDAGTVAVDDLGYSVAPLAAGAACLWRARRRPGKPDLAWYYLAISCLLWAGSETSWAIYEVWLELPPPYPSPADYGYLLAAPIAIAALIRMSGLRRGLADTTRTVMDALLAAGALLFLSWDTVLRPAIQQSTESLLETLVGAAYPFSDVAIATVALITMARVGGERRVGIALIGIGLLGLGVSDWTFAYALVNGTYSSNVWDVGGFAGFLLVMLAALRPEPEATPGHRDAEGGIGLSLPYLPLLVAAVAAVVMHLQDTPVGSFLFWDGLFLVALILVRQLVGLYANVALSRELRASLGAVQEREVALEYQAFHDSLTGLPNRDRFEELVTAALDDRARRPVIVMLLDLDGFKQVNDTYGHHAGDRLLRQVGDRLLRSVRADDAVARLGGDEFALLLGRNATLNEATAVAGRVLDGLRDPVDVGDAQVRVTASVGLVPAGPEGDFEEVLRRADVAMYEAKRAGKNTCVVYEELSRSDSGG